MDLDLDMSMDMDMDMDIQMTMTTLTSINQAIFFPQNSADSAATCTRPLDVTFGSLRTPM